MTCDISYMLLKVQEKPLTHTFTHVPFVKACILSS